MHSVNFLHQHYNYPKMTNNSIRYKEQCSLNFMITLLKNTKKCHMNSFLMQKWKCKCWICVKAIVKGSLNDLLEYGVFAELQIINLIPQETSQEASLDTAHILPLSHTCSGGLGTLNSWGCLR